MYPTWKYFIELYVTYRCCTSTCSKVTDAMEPRISHLGALASSMEGARKQGRYVDTWQNVVQNGDGGHCGGALGSTVLVDFSLNKI